MPDGADATEREMPNGAFQTAPTRNGGAVWRLASFGTSRGLAPCAVRHSRRSASAPFGIRAVRHFAPLTLYALYGFIQ
jgi:hypothetical protein